MSDVTSLALVVGSATLINTVYAVKKEKDPTTTLVASGVMFTGLSLFGGLTDEWELATAFAWVFLLASLITRGTTLIQTANSIANSKSSGNGGGGGGGGGR